MALYTLCGGLGLAGNGSNNNQIPYLVANSAVDLSTKYYPNPVQDPINGFTKVRIDFKKLLYAMNQYNGASAFVSGDRYAVLEIPRGSIIQNFTAVVIRQDSNGQGLNGSGVPINSNTAQTLGNTIGIGDTATPLKYSQSSAGFTASNTCVIGKSTGIAVGTCVNAQTIVGIYPTSYDAIVVTVATISTTDALPVDGVVELCFQIMNVCPDVVAINPAPWVNI